jgi:hypothetical protein
VPEKNTTVTFAKVRLGVGKMGKRAQEQAERVPWRGLLQARNEYVESECFLFWLRSIEESAGYLPDRVWKTIEHEYPVFLDDEIPYLERHGDAWVWKRLDQWIFNHVWGEVRREGWMDAVLYYAAPDRRYLRAEAYWLKCVRAWTRNKPRGYPAFPQWRRAAFKCSELGIVRPRLREMLRPADHVSADRFTEAVDRYVDWEEFASWARTGLEQRPEIPQFIAKELRQRCPGFVESDRLLRPTDPSDQYRAGLRLLDWIITHFFSHAKREGWFSVIHHYAQLHPHWVRMMRYSSRWQRDWREGRIKAYPTFEGWCQAIDNYTEEEPDGRDEE